MGMTDETLTVDEAAAYLRVDSVTIQRELRRGRLLGTRVGKAWRISKEVLSGYVRGGDPTRGMIEAGGHFHRDDVDGGLRVLLRHFASVAADPAFPSEWRADLLRRLAVLAEADERGSAKRAREAAFKDGDRVWIEERSGTLTGLTVNLQGLWNRTVVGELAEALVRRREEKRS